MAITTNSTTNTTTPSSTIKAESAAPPTSPPLVLPPWISSPTSPAPPTRMGAQVPGQPEMPRPSRQPLPSLVPRTIAMLPSLAALCPSQQGRELGFFGLADAAMTCVDVDRLGGWAFEEVQGGSTAVDVASPPSTPNTATASSRANPA
ncbi:hypothetical protein B0H14DRAFT_3431740 [Mycena olivaceomarginata]|nr:hypothetical protein B0H14DRAFT_3431740 [Mycena olivaceomarginata]